MTRGNNTDFGSAAAWLFHAVGEFLKFIRNLTESFFYVHVTVLHRNKCLFNKNKRRTNFPSLFCQETPLPIIRSSLQYIRHWYMSCNFDDSFHARPGRAWKLSSKLRYIYQCRMNNGKLLMMGRGTAPNM
jgi:hypothetical protein